MEILILGGTGAMGIPLVNLLKKSGHELYVTSRKKIPSSHELHYIQGNAKDDGFFELLMRKNYDVIIDFMIYTPDELKKRLDKILSHTKQYFFFSSSRVYAQAEENVTEESPRLLDVCSDQIYLQTDEYALVKAREEDLLKNHKQQNWTIIRPYITYNNQRLQLGVYEKENWLYRALKGRTIVFPKDIAKSKTSLTYGPDVAATIINLIGNKNALGQIFQIVNNEVATWENILEIYLDIIEKKMNKRPKVKMIDNSDGLQKVWSPWQIKYDRLFDRIFDNNKIEKICGKYNYKSMESGLHECLSSFLDNPQWLNFNWRYEAWADKQAQECTPLGEIEGIRTKAKYVKWRYFS